MMSLSEVDDIPSATAHGDMSSHAPSEEIEQNDVTCMVRNGQTFIGHNTVRSISNCQITL